MYATPTSSTECASDTADAGQPVLARELGRPLVATTDQPGVVDLDPVDERRQRRHPASLSSDPRNRSNGCGMPDETALLANGGHGLGGRHPRRDGALQERGDQVPVGGPDLLPDDHGQPVRRRLTRRERPVDPVVIRDDDVGQAPFRRCPNDIRRPRRGSRTTPTYDSAGR